MMIFQGISITRIISLFSGTVPVYQALESVCGSIEKLDEDDFLLIIEKHSQKGMDIRPFMRAY